MKGVIVARSVVVELFGGVAPTVVAVRICLLQLLSQIMIAGQLTRPPKSKGFYHLPTIVSALSKALIFWQVCRQRMVCAGDTEHGMGPFREVPEVYFNI